MSTSPRTAAAARPAASRRPTRGLALPLIGSLAAACLLSASSVLLAHRSCTADVPATATTTGASDRPFLSSAEVEVQASSPSDPSEPEPSWRAYASHLTAIRCFITPGCFLGLRCRSGEPRKVRRGRRNEERSFCVDDLRGAAAAANATASASESAEGGGGGGANATAIATAAVGRCLIYSVGLFHSWNFESKAARLFGCDVHAFDPTMGRPPSGTAVAPGVTFHRLGLQGEGTNMSATHGAEYEPIRPELLLTLGEIMTRLGHRDRKIDLLVMDCEGCEWGVLRQMACGSDDSRFVGQLSVEFHFQRSLGLRDESDVQVAAEAVQCLEREGWGITSIESSGAGRLDWQYARGMAGVVHNAGFLAYVALRRVDAEGGEGTPAEINERYIAESVEFQRVYDRLRPEHGWDMSKWPGEVFAELDPYNRRKAQVLGRYNRIVNVERVKFDEHPYMDEEK